MPPDAPELLTDYLDRLLLTLDARVEAFAICDVNESRALALGPAAAPLIHLVIEGEGEIFGRKMASRLRAGTLVVAPARRRHVLSVRGEHAPVVESADRCEALSEGLLRFSSEDGARAALRTACATVEARYWSELGFFDRLDDIVVVEPERAPQCPDLFDAMARELAEPKLGARALASALLKQALVHIVRAELFDETDGGGWIVSLRDERLGRAVAAVLDSPSDRHSTDTLAEIAGMSRSSFTRRFAEVFGMTVTDFLTRVRMRRAAILLRSTDLPVKVVARTVGYGSRSHFSESFRRLHGVDPSDYRRRSPPEASRGPLAPLLNRLFG